MSRTIYYVLSASNRWKIRHNEKDYHYDTQREAIQAAVNAAHSSGNKGWDAQVLVQRENGQWRTEWTYGHDPYPPRG